MEGGVGGLGRRRSGEMRRNWLEGNKENSESKVEGGGGVKGQGWG